MKKNNAVRFAAVCCAAVLSVGVAPVVANTPSLSVSVSAETLSAPKNIKTKVSGNELVVTWDKVKGASAYKIDVKYPGKDWAPLPTVSTVSSPRVRIPYLKYGDTVSVRIYALKKTSSGYSQGSAAKFQQKFICNKIAMGSNNVPVIDTSLLGKSAKTIESKLGNINLVKDANSIPYSGRYYLSKDQFAALNFDANKKNEGIYIALPLDSWNKDLQVDLERTYGEPREVTPYDGGDFGYHYHVSGNTWLQVSTQVYDSGEKVMFYWFFNAE